MKSTEICEQTSRKSLLQKSSERFSSIKVQHLHVFPYGLFKRNETRQVEEEEEDDDDDDDEDEEEKKNLLMTMRIT
jgi:hypothetical protein